LLKHLLSDRKRKSITKKFYLKASVALPTYTKIDILKMTWCIRITSRLDLAKSYSFTTAYPVGIKWWGFFSVVYLRTRNL